MMLSLEDVSFSYGEQTRSTSADVLFEHLDLDVADGEKVLVLGQSGEGKTTLCSIISLIAPKYTGGSLEGRILHDGRPYECVHDMLDFFSLVPQNPGDWFLETCCEDEIALPLEALGVQRDDMVRRVGKALDEWGLERYRDRPLGGLSGGEKKRLAIAGALVSGPRLCVYDESFDDLDASWRLALRNAISSSPAAAIVTSCRFLDVFRDLFDSIYRIRDGRLVRIGQEEASQADVFPFTPPPMHPDGGVLEVRDLVFRRADFSLSVPSFRLCRGQVVCLSGANGSGKSTFSRLLCALEDKTSGSIMIDGMIQDSSCLMRRVGYVFQNPDHQIFLPNVRDELMSCLEPLGIDRAEKERRVDEAASLFGLAVDESATLMSYGRRKRLQCAIYYLLDRPYYILDEIEAALPASDAALMVRLLAGRGAGILVISHDSIFASRIAARRYEIREGVMHEV